MTEKTSCFQDDISDVSEPLTPLDSFFEYLSEEFFEEVAAQTNLYSVQQSLKSMNTNAKEIIRLVGHHVWMDTLKFPQVILVPEFELDCFSEAMIRNRFSTFRQNLYFVDNLAPHNDSDKLWKVQPFLQAIKEKCLSLPRLKQISFDEQMIPFTGRCSLRQYVPNKPNPVELKNFVLSARDGLVLDFIIYDGKAAFLQKICEIMDDWGHSKVTFCYYSPACNPCLIH
ncbi:hypothetical protein AVEN_63061-1 [Araneus ventricosus]|uniref:PiggyBac transposable element-derived protein domain-containing protein n=1 Tax=Araneus ventricosus TaxID=182803 RepID=A0A4Y2H3M9_ARAVE|nr:hypothetical protein AVEN_63061-1 [Araneus ventricosus]